jgi:HPt (histidine-containing phosphotransfer) domain-containing protein
MTKLLEQLANQDWKQARLLVHTLRGSSGNLGAIKMQKLTTDLEEAIKNEENLTEIKQLAAEVECELQQLIASIHTFLPAEIEIAYQGKIDWAEIRQTLLMLETMLVDSSAEANKLIETHAPQLKAALGILGGELEQQIEMFCYPEALEVIKQAQEKYPVLNEVMQ